MEMTLWDQWSELKKNGLNPRYGASAENCLIESGTQLGIGTNIWPDVTIGREVVLGNHITIGKGATIVGKIKIRDNVIIGHHVEITGEGYIGDNCEIKSDINNPRMKKNCKVLTSA